MSFTCGVRRIHLQIFQQGAFFTFIEAGKANHAVERADPTVSVKVGYFRCAVALVTGAVVQRIRISPDRFDIVHHVAFLHPRSGLQLAPLGIGVGNGGFLQCFHLLLHITTNRGNKDAFTWELGEYTLTSCTFRPASDFRVEFYSKRGERFAGESKYPLKKMISFALDGITSTSAAPMRLIFWIGLIWFLLAIVGAIYIIARHFINGSDVAGWASTMLAIIGFGGANLLALGVIGEYIGKIFLEVKQRPRYLIEDFINED